MDQTPLHKAAASGSTDVAKLLLDHGAKVDARDFLGATPLSWAATGGHKNVATLLLARGALVNARTRADETSVHPAAETPLHLAAASGNKEMVALLLARGADVNARNGDGQTPLEEMQASSLDAATKTSIAAVLQAKPKVQAASPAQLPTPQQGGPAEPFRFSPGQGQQPPAASAAPTQSTGPDCWDVQGIARWVTQANPGIKPGVLWKAVEKYQILTGCRPAPQKTECSWFGDTWTCKTQ
jgi:Ankyrin repeats (3 copies)/Ankyrin repeats (many copies)